MRKTLLLAGIFAALAAAACGGEQLDVGRFAVDGRWAGTARLPITATENPADSARYDFLLDLEQSERDISGDGEVSTDAESLDIDVRGRWDYPSVDMIFTAPEFASVAFDATYGANRDTIRGTITGSGFAATPLVIVRQSAAAP
jgi:hypothetical protein